MNPSNRKAVLPGSYDPITNGHLDVIERAARMYDEIVVGVVNVQVRKSKALFGAEERCSMVEQATSHLPNITVLPFSTLLVDFAHEQGAGAIVKGLRSITDFGFEFEMNQLNRRQDPDIESVYLMASPQYSFLSSSGVKELAQFDGNIDDLVPPGIAVRLKEALKR
jgi:pantetheine-phosphate adenylyltransferase